MVSEFETYSKINFSLAEVSRFDGKNVPNHIALEGNVGAGKSTVAIFFGQKYNLPHIGEYGNYVDFAGGERFPIFPPEDNLSVISSNPLWINLEFRRQTHMIEAIRSERKDLLLVERSPLSLVAFEYAKMKQGLPYEISNLVGNYAMLIDTDQIKEPSGYVFLNTTPDTVGKRIAERGGRSIDFLFNPTTCTQIEDFFVFFKRNYLTTVDYIDIQTDNKGPVTISGEIRLFMVSDSQKVSSRPFNRFCKDILTDRFVFEQI